MCGADCGRMLVRHSGPLRSDTSKPCASTRERRSQTEPRLAASTAQWRRMAPRPGTPRSTSMKDLRLFTTSAACALGAAILATTVLQSTAVEAREIKRAEKHPHAQLKPAEKKPHGETRQPERQPPKQPLPTSPVTAAKPVPTGTTATSASAINSQSGGTKASSSSSSNGG